MGLSLSFYVNVGVLGFFLILTYIFYKHTMKFKRPVKSLRFFAIIGIFYSFFVIWYELTPSDSYWIKNITKAIYLTLSGIQTLIFFYFIRSIYPKSLTKIPYFVLFGLFLLQMIGLWSPVFLNQPISLPPNAIEYFSILRKMGYNLGALYVFGIISTMFYWKMFRYSTEKRAFMLFLGMVFTGIGYLLTLVCGVLLEYFSSTILDTLKTIGDILPVFGLLLSFTIYARFTNYIFRIPYDHYFLFIMHNSGIKLYRMDFKTQNKSIEIQENLFAGMISAINSIYTNLLKSSFSIQEISSRDAALHIEKGDFVTCIMATDYLSSILVDGMQQFVKEFEDTFRENLSQKLFNLDEFHKTEQIFQNIFPFIQIAHKNDP